MAKVKAKKDAVVPGTWLVMDVARLVHEADALSESLREHRRWVVAHTTVPHAPDVRKMLARSERLIKIRGPL